MVSLSLYVPPVSVRVMRGAWCRHPRGMTGDASGGKQLAIIAGVQLQGRIRARHLRVIVGNCVRDLAIMESRQAALVMKPKHCALVGLEAVKDLQRIHGRFLSPGCGLSVPDAQQINKPDQLRKRQKDKKEGCKAESLALCNECGRKPHEKGKETMQSSNLEKAREMRDAYETEHEREAFAAGYDHAHGIACHNVPTIGEEYFTDSLGRITPADADEAREAHEILCYEAESNARSFSPWEFTAHEINSLPEFDAEAAWEAYEAGVSAAIEHDLAGYTAESYGEEEGAA